ncbi:MAG: nitroreductase [Fibrobacter sp.]|jgi:nitroreductase|nr:nitroreductase [Fibrobacter sp.]
MNPVLQAIQSRKSIREFSEVPVSEEIIREILETAARAPSSKNTQPWKLFLVTGNALSALREDYGRAFDERKEPELELSNTLFPAYRDRAMNLGKAIFAHKGILREDKEKRRLHDRANFEFFNAPQIFMLAVNKEAYHEITLMDCGIFASYLMLAIHGAELGCCPQTSTIIYPSILRKHIPHSEDLRFLMIFPFGKPREGSRLNEFHTEREPVASWFTEVRD